MAEHAAVALHPELAAYLDWPVSYHDNELWCDRQGCTIGACNGDESRAWIVSRYGLTARLLLAGVKAHALDEVSTDG